MPLTIRQNDDDGRASDIADGTRPHGQIRNMVRGASIYRTVHRGVGRASGRVSGLRRVCGPVCRNAAALTGSAKHSSCVERQPSRRGRKTHSAPLNDQEGAVENSCTEAFRQNGLTSGRSSSPSGGLRAWACSRPCRVRLRRLPRGSATRCRAAGAPFHVRGSAG